ncbi:MAG: sigma 54-interacting transcriptional regulator [Polyangiales bacterium]
MLVLGETGTGKSALAERVVHRASRRSGRFVAVDLGAPSTLAAAELFGSARGAFSGAVDRPGRFEEADGGIAFPSTRSAPCCSTRKVCPARVAGRPGDAARREPRAFGGREARRRHQRGSRGEGSEGEFRPDLYARLNPASRLTLPPCANDPEDRARSRAW